MHHRETYLGALLRFADPVPQLLQHVVAAIVSACRSGNTATVTCDSEASATARTGFGLIAGAPHTNAAVTTAYTIATTAEAQDPTSMEHVLAHAQI